MVPGGPRRLGPLALHLVGLLPERGARLLRQVLQGLFPLRGGGRFLDVLARGGALLFRGHRRPQSTGRSMICCSLRTSSSWPVRCFSSVRGCLCLLSCSAA